VNSLTGLADLILIEILKKKKDLIIVEKETMNRREVDEL